LVGAPERQDEVRVGHDLAAGLLDGDRREPRPALTALEVEVTAVPLRRQRLRLEVDRSGRASTLSRFDTRQYPATSSSGSRRYASRAGMRRPTAPGARLEPVEDLVRDGQVEDADLVGALRDVAVAAANRSYGVRRGRRREVDLDEDLVPAHLAAAALQALHRAVPAPRRGGRVHVDLGPDLVRVVVQAHPQRGDADDSPSSSTAHFSVRSAGRRTATRPRLLVAVAVVPRPLVRPAGEHRVVDGGALASSWRSTSRSLGRGQGRYGRGGGHVSTVEASRRRANAFRTGAERGARPLCRHSAE
jgi:hypothetical protein